MPDLSAATVPMPAGPLAAPEAAPEEAAPSIPSPFIDVVQGNLPGVTLAPIEGDRTDPAQEYAVQNLENLVQAGLEYHETPSLNSVLFNPQKVTAAQIDEADKAGKLFEIAPLIEDLAAPEAAAEAAPAAAGAAPMAAAPAPVAAGALSSAKVPTNSNLQTARLKNIKPAPAAAPNPVPGVLAKRAI